MGVKVVETMPALEAHRKFAECFHDIGGTPDEYLSDYIGLHYLHVLLYMPIGCGTPHGMKTSV